MILGSTSVVWAEKVTIWWLHMMRHLCCFFFNECLFRSLETPAELLVLALLLSSTPGWAPATHITRSCRGKSPSWRSATCEEFQNETRLFISNNSSSEISTSVCRRDISPDLQPASVALQSPPAVRWSVHFVCQWSYILFFVFLPSWPQVTNGPIAKAAGSDHEHIKQAGPDWDLCIGMSVFSVCPQTNKPQSSHFQINNHYTNSPSCWAS